MKKPLVSVLISSYNHKEFIGKTIESVLKQTYQNFEVIIADDGSTDGSVSEIRRYKDSRIHLELAPQNTDFGIIDDVYQIAKGDYITILASDDYWSPFFLEKNIAFLEEHREYGCCFCHPMLVNEKDEFLENTQFCSEWTKEQHSKEEWFRKLYQEGNLFCAGSMCMREEIFKTLLPMRFQYRQLQDYEFWLRFLQKGSIYFLQESLVYYRIHTNGYNKNISAPSVEVYNRDLFERKYILLDLMEHVDDGFFLKAFEQDLTIKPGQEGFCIACEKFGVMLNSPAVPTEAALSYYYRHYNEPEFKICLEKYYHVSRKDFWQLTGNNYDIVEIRRQADKRERELLAIIRQLRAYLEPRKEME